MNPLHVAVDARDLAHDWRGIARYVRAILTRFAQRDDVRVTMVERGPFGFQRAPRRADVVWHPWNGTFFRSSAPSVVTFHDAVPFWCAAGDPKIRHNEQAPWQRSAQTGAAFLANSQFTVDEVSRYLGVDRSRQTITYLAVEPEVFTPYGEANALPDGRPFVLFAGAADPRKNIGTLIAAHRLAFPGGDVALVVAGAAPPPAAGVHFIGAVEPLELARWYRGARLVAVPSLYEGFGFPLLEAMACGTPAIATRGSSLVEVGGNACAWIEDPLDAHAWATGLQSLAGDDDVHALLRDAGLAQAATFSWDRCAEETLAVLRRTALGR
jgi:glycosyltransferase involved in cell wall biosynthesis